jgi:hypothetical protein
MLYRYAVWSPERRMQQHEIFSRVGKMSKGRKCVPCTEKRKQQLRNSWTPERRAKQAQIAKETNLKKRQWTPEQKLAWSVKASENGKKGSEVRWHLTGERRK